MASVTIPPLSSIVRTSTTSSSVVVTSAGSTTSVTSVDVPPTSESNSISSSSSSGSTTSASSTSTLSFISPSVPTFATSVRVTTSGNNVITITSVVDASPTDTLAPSQSGDTAPKSFFQNTAAVAGVFSVVGIIGIALLFILITNAIRRRRAQQFDRDVAEAAAAAAAAQVPVFEEEDDAYGNSGQYTRYSDNSHGTFGQPPMAHAGTGESYGMSEIMNPYDPFGSNVGAGGAGVGVGAAMQRARSRKEIRADITGMAGYDAGGVTPGYGEQSSPYPAFSGPHQQQIMYNTAPPPPGQVAPGPGPYGGPGNVTYDLMDAAGLGIARGPSQRLPDTGNVDLSRSRSQGARTMGAEGAYGPGAVGGNGQDHVRSESYAAHYQPGYQHQSPPPPLPTSSDEAYGGGYIGPSHAAETSTNSQPPARAASRNGSGSEYSDNEGNSHVVDDQASLKDEEDYELEREKRVLKVANV